MRGGRWNRYRPRVTTLYTIGYQSATVADFLDALEGAGVELLVDVRAVAASRRPGFAKSALAANLETRKIAYYHIRSVGTPSDGRVKAKAGDHAGMRAIYLEYLKTDDAQSGLSELEALIRLGRPTCIMCFEDDPTHCHRSIVAATLQERMPLRVQHLRPEHTV